MYEDTPERFAEATVLERDNVLLFEHEADHFRSAYSIALVPDRKEVRYRDSLSHSPLMKRSRRAEMQNGSGLGMSLGALGSPLHQGLAGTLG